MSKKENITKQEKANLLNIDINVYMDKDLKIHVELFDKINYALIGILENEKDGFTKSIVDYVFNALSQWKEHLLHNINEIKNDAKKITEMMEKQGLL